MATNRSHELLKVDALSVRYGPVLGLSEGSLSVKVGEFIALVGANGAGKSSMLGAIAGICDRSEGRIYFDGVDTTKSSTHEIVRSGIALCPEGRGILSEMSVKENLLLGAYHNRAKISNNLEKVFKLFPILEERFKQTASLMSGGEQQMLSIGRAMMSEPRLLLLDEPSLGLAPVVVDEILEAVQVLCQNGLTVLLAEEGTGKVFRYAQRAYVMKVGRVVLEGSTDKLRDHPELTNAYLGVSYKTDKIN